jgi:hypothetical protein
MTYAGDPRVLFPLFDMPLEPEQIPLSYVGIVGQFERGPMWEGRAFSSKQVDEFINTYGNSVDWTRDPLCVIEAMRNGANVVIHRLGHCTDLGDRSTLDILPASVLIPDRGGVPSAGFVQSAVGPFTFLQALSGRVTGTELGPFAIVLDTNDKFKVRLGVPGTWGAEQTATLTAGAARTAQQVCDDINAGTTGLNATVVDGAIYLEAVDVADDIEIMAVTHDAYSATGFVAGVSAHVVGTDGLVISINAGADQPFNLEPAHGEISSFALTSAEVVTQLAALTGATLSSAQGKVKITSGTTGPTSSVQVKAASTAATALGFDTLLHSGDSGTVKNPWKYELAKTPGSHGNGAKIYFTDAALNPGDAMNVRILIPGEPEQYFRELTRDPNDPRFWKNYINSHDKYGRIVDATDTPNAAPNDWPALNGTGLELTGGDDGTLVLTDADWIGDAAGKTGLYCTDHWQLPFINIFIFGTTSSVVADGLHTFIEGRKGRFGWHPMPPVATSADAVAFRMQDPAAGYTQAAFNTYSSGTVGGYFEVLDVKNNERVEIPALAWLAAAICKTDQAHGRHVSPFGVKRGQCSDVLGIDYNPGEDPGGADLLFEYQINNGRILRTSLENRGWEGAYLWGGQTLQRAFSVMREFPVVHKIKEYQWMFYPVGLSFINDPNHPVVWREVYRTLNPILRADLTKGAIYGFVLVCDEDAFFNAEGELKGAVLNTGPDIDQGIYRCRILIQPVRQIFYFVIEMGIMKTGEPFVNYSTMYSLPGWARR